MQFGRVMVNSLVGYDDSFSRSDIDTMADAMWSAGQNSVPVIVTKGRYNEELGDFEYVALNNSLIVMAARQNREQDPRTWEYINCFIINGADNVNAILRQFELMTEC